MHRGYIRIYRKSKESRIWEMPALYLKVWQYILLSVNWKPTRIPGRGNMGIWLSPGMMPCSSTSICEAIRWRENDRGRRHHIPARNTVDKILEWLNKEGMIHLHRDRIGTLVTVDNWHVYQQDMAGIEQPTEQPIEQPIEQRREHSEELFKNYKKKKERTKQAATFRLPEWVPADAWNGFVEMRTRIKEPMTDRAVTLLINKLDKLRSEGHDPEAVLDQSIIGNWKTVYPLKNEPGNGSKTSKPQVPAWCARPNLFAQRACANACMKFDEGTGCTLKPSEATA